MTCRECQMVLEEYVDGELGPKQAEAVGEHLSTCNVCMVEFNQLRAELEVFQRNSPDIEVKESLWAGVQARLEAKEPSVSNRALTRPEGWLAGYFSAPRFSVPVTVGLVLAAVVMTTVVIKFLPGSQKGSSAVQSEKSIDNSNRMESPELKASPATAKVVVPEFNRSEESKPRKGRDAQLSPVVRSIDSKSPEQLVRDAEKKYLAAIGMLSRDIERSQSQLDQETRTKFEQALAAIDRTIGATRKAVREHPTDPIAVQYMLSAYARKVDVLREMVGSGAF